MLKSGHLYFSSPSQLNDPTDCKLPLLVEKGTEKQIYKKNLEHYQLLYPKVSKKRLKKEARYQAKVIHGRIDDQERKKQFRSTIVAQNEKRFGIASFSTNNTNELLWAHYAKSHTGFCVGFDVSVLLEVADALVYNGIVFDSDYVKYFDELPGVNPYNLDEIEQFKMMAFSKSSAWNYEEEWRLLSLVKNKFAIPLPEKAVRAVYLGMSCSPADAELVVEILQSRERRPAIFKASMSENHDKILFEEISYT